MPERLFVLLTNDDGINAPGLRALEAAFAPVAEVFTVAPSRERSGGSQAITLGRPFRAHAVGTNRFAIDGYPVDCVHYALRTFFPREPDWIISGINRGPNLGDDTLYSGTVGAALTGSLAGIKSMAVSMADLAEVMHYGTAAAIARRLALTMPKDAIPLGHCLNVNVPNVPPVALKGHAVCGLAKRHYDKTFHVEPDAQGRTLCSYGKGRPGHDGPRGSDCSESEAGYVTLTILKPSFFDAAATEALGGRVPTDLLDSLSSIVPSRDIHEPSADHA